MSAEASECQLASSLTEVLTPYNDLSRQAAEYERHFPKPGSVCAAGVWGGGEGEGRAPAL